GRGSDAGAPRQGRPVVLLHRARGLRGPHRADRSVRAAGRGPRVPDHRRRDRKRRAAAGAAPRRLRLLRLPAGVRAPRGTSRPRQARCAAGEAARAEAGAMSARKPRLRLVDAPAGDEDARAAIRTDLDRNFIVEAAAGTGKTTELVHRIVAVLRSGRATVDRIVGVTFTEKAAGELKLRVREGLERARHEAPAGSVERLHLESALARLEEAWVGTIHGFCAEILHERSVEAGVDPNFEVLTESGARRAFREGFRHWLEEQLAAPPAGVRRSLRRSTSRANEDDGPIARLEVAGWALAEWRDFDADWRRDPFDREGALDELIQVLHEYAALAERCANPARDAHFKASAPARTLSLEIRTAESVRERDYDGIEARFVDLARNRDFTGAPAGYGETYAPGVRRAELVARHRALVAGLAGFQRRADADLASLVQGELGG